MNIDLEKTGATFSSKRENYYAEGFKQLDLLYHDIDAGKLGETAKTSSFYLARKAVKDKYPSG
jgi:hypothetical protein|tara:strand:- start:427 stop:615 length:189 start_codon:yes stop_codon:yes gene_type:complete